MGSRAARVIVVDSRLACLASLVFLACGQVADGVDAASDAAAETDGRNCLPNGAFEPDISPPYCCSRSAIQNICVQTCFPHGNGCDLPEATCCSDADTCIDGVCR